jgi:hypothetical protein
MGPGEKGEEDMTHTAGPLEVRPSSNPKNGTLWRDIVSLGTDFSPSYVGEALEDDAHRLVACWNACEGINPEAVPAMRALVAALVVLATHASTGGHVDWAIIAKKAKKLRAHMNEDAALVAAKGEKP